MTEILDDVPVEYLVPVTSNRLPNGTEFTRLKIANELNVGGLIDGVNFTEMLDQRIPVKGDCIITGNMIFTGDLNAGVKIVPLPMSLLKLNESIQAMSQSAR